MAALKAQHRCHACSMSSIFYMLKGTDDAVNCQNFQYFSLNVFDNFSVPHSVFFFKNYLYVVYVCECDHIYVGVCASVCVELQINLEYPP